MTTPLALSLARDTYATRGDPRELFDTAKHGDPESLLRHLLTRFVAQAYPDRRERERAVWYLSVAAATMGSERDLRWWEIPSWTKIWPAGVLFGLPGGVLGAYACVQIVGLPWPVAAALSAVACAGLGKGLSFEEGPRRLPMGVGFDREAMLFWSRRGANGGAFAFGLHGCLWGILIGLGSSLGAATGAINGIAVGILWGAVGGVIVGGVRGGFANGVDRPPDLQGGSRPLQSYRMERRYSRWVAWTDMVWGAVHAGFMYPLVWVAWPSVLGLLWGGGDHKHGRYGFILAGTYPLGVAFLFWACVGIGFWIDFATRLRIHELVLALHGRPVRVMPLLETALDRQILRQAGVAYQFRHAELQDLFLNWAGQDPSETLSTAALGAGLIP